MRGYEFRIFGQRGNVSLIIHSCHFSDTAAIRSAKKYAGDAPFEVWRDLERLLPKQSSRKPKIIAKASEKESTRLYDFKLSGRNQDPLLFAAALANDEEAADRARILLKRHGNMTHAEIWYGMKLISQV